MKIYQYTDYEEYVKIQSEANKLKIDFVWVDQKSIQTIASRFPKAEKILCHGTRNGEEIKLFQKFLPSASVIGTEISDTATQFPNTVQHDFHEQREEWMGQFDIVYSNSWDHSYDPNKSLLAWTNQLNETGVICLDYAVGAMENKSRPWDPFEANHDEILEILQKHELEIIEIIDSSKRNSKCNLYIVKRK